MLKGSLPEGLLDSYDAERHDAAREMVDVAVMLGDQIQPTDAAAAAERDAMFAAINADPAAAQAFSNDVIAPLKDVRMQSGWLADHDCAGRLLPQPDVPEIGEDRRLDDALGTGFTALVQGEPSIADAVAAHPLWQGMYPTVLSLPEELKDFALLAPGEILLVRPDRFVMAKLSAGENALPQLDAMLAALEAEPAHAAVTA